jgi:hypothetical protein
MATANPHAVLSYRNYSSPPQVGGTDLQYIDQQSGKLLTTQTFDSYAYHGWPLRSGQGQERVEVRVQCNYNHGLLASEVKYPGVTRGTESQFTNVNCLDLGVTKTKCS